MKSVCCDSSVTKSGQVHLCDECGQPCHFVEYSPPENGIEINPDFYTPRLVRLTLEEAQILKHLAASYNKFIKLPNAHPADNPDFARAIHNCQLLIAGRVAKRVNPEIWTV